MNKQEILSKIRSYDSDLFGPLSSEEQFHPELQKDGFSGHEVIIGIDNDFVNYEITPDKEVFDTELEHLSLYDLIEIERILEDRKTDLDKTMDRCRDENF